ARWGRRRVGVVTRIGRGLGPRRRTARRRCRRRFSALGCGNQLSRRGLDRLLGRKLGARIELVGAIVPAECVDDYLLALSARAVRMEQVSEQEVQRAVVATVVDGQGAGGSLCLHRLEQRREPAVTKGTL